LIYVPGLPRESGAVGRGRELEWRTHCIRTGQIFKEKTNQQKKNEKQQIKPGNRVAS